jgi:hypothetical protein
MGDMAGLAAIRLDGHVLKDEGTGLVGVAPHTPRLGTDRGVEQSRELIHVWVVAVATFQGSFQHGMTERFAEAGFHGSVATGAKICGVGFLEKMGRLFVGVEAVAVRASDFAPPVTGPVKRGKEKEGFVTLQAAIGTPSHRPCSEAHAHIVATRLDMGLTHAVAGLTVCVFVGGFGVERSQVMADHAHIVAQIILRFAAGRWLGTTGRKEDRQ